MQRNIYTINLRALPDWTQPLCCPGYPVPCPIHLSAPTLYSGQNRERHTGRLVRETSQITGREIKMKGGHGEKREDKKTRLRKTENKELRACLQKAPSRHPKYTQQQLWLHTYSLVYGEQLSLL